MSETRQDLSSAQLDLARQLLHLEQQLEAYQNLHNEELEQIRSTLSECKRKLLIFLEYAQDDAVEKEERCA